MSKLVGICPKCLELKELSRHHIFPRRWFKRKEIIFFCRECHNNIEFIISQRERGKVLPEYLYLEIIKSFLQKKARKLIFIKREIKKTNGSKLLELPFVKNKAINPAI